MTQLAHRTGVDDTRGRAMVLSTASLGTFLVILLTSGLNIMSPQLREDLGASSSDLAWVLSGYTLAFAMFSLAGGALSDRFGAHRIFVVGLMLFAVFSATAAAAPNVAFVVAGSFGEGVGAALVLPAALALVEHTYRDDHKRLGSAIGLWAGANALGAAVGPVVCGALVTAASWRVAFVVIAITAVLFGLLGMRMFPKVPTAAGPIDVAGLIVMIAMLGVVAFIAHDFGTLAPWMIVVGLIIAAALVWLFGRVERRASAPMLPISQLRDVVFSGNAVVTIVGTAAFFGPLYVISIGLQDKLGMTAFIAGVGLLPLAGGNILTALVAGRVQTRIGVWRTMILGSALVVAALIPIPWLFSDYELLIAPLVILGMGWGLLVPSTSAAGLRRALSGKSGVASGITAGGREFGAALAAAVLLPLGTSIGILAATGVGVASLLVVLITVRNADRPMIREDGAYE